jgi:hypothetical protein
MSRSAEATQLGVCGVEERCEHQEKRNSEKMKITITIAATLALGVWLGWLWANRCWLKGLETYFKYDHPDDWERHFRVFMTAFVARCRSKGAVMS